MTRHGFVESTATPFCNYALISYDPASNSKDTLQAVAQTSRAALLARQLQSVTQDLERYSRYPRGWDGYGATCFDQDLIESVARHAARLRTAFASADVVPDLFDSGPASDGSIDIEMRLQDRMALLTFFPGPNHRIRAFGQRASGEKEEYVTPVDSFPLGTWAAWLTGESMLPDAKEKPRPNPR